MNRTITYSRSDLFDLVWSTPILKLAKQIGVSDVGLAKACRKVGIPLPGRGYWAKSEERRPEQPPLPKMAGENQAEVTFTTLDPAVFQLTRKTMTDIPRIEIPPTLVDPDVLVATTIKASLKAEQYNGRIVLRKKNALAISISPSALDRAMLLLDTLIKACRQRGYAWKLSPEGKTLIQCEGKDIEVTLKERLSKHELPRRKRKRYDWEGPGAAEVFATREYEWVSTNFLTFAVENHVAGSARRSWADGNVVKLEEKLHEIVAGLPLVAQGIELLDLERERWKRKCEDEEAKRRKARRKAEVTRRLRATLVASTNKSYRAERIRAFCDRLEARTCQISPELLPKCSAWLEWARQQADLLDPLSGDFTDLVSMTVDLPEWFGEESYVKPPSDWWTE